MWCGDQLTTPTASFIYVTDTICMYAGLMLNYTYGHIYLDTMRKHDEYPTMCVLFSCYMLYRRILCMPTLARYLLFCIFSSNSQFAWEYYYILFFSVFRSMALLAEYYDRRSHNIKM